MWRMIVQISKSHTHVMMHRVRNSDRYAETENPVRQPERIQIAITEEQRAGNETPDQR